MRQQVTKKPPDGGWLEDGKQWAPQLPSAYAKSKGGSTALRLDLQTPLTGLRSVSPRRVAYIGCRDQPSIIARVS